MLRNLLTALTLCLVFSLAACGFEPLYAKKGNDQDSSIQGSVKINKMYDREGQILHNRLLDLINPKGQPKEADYALSAVIAKSTQSLGLNEDESTQLKVSRVQVNFTLTGHNQTHEFFIIRKGSFSESVNAYATYVAENDAVRRNLEEIAADAKIRIATIIAQDKQ